ncbi:MAG: DUF3467 domain-containing protein [Propionibacteriaceae bacterium]|jgi:hypothetical protein|nr:DUF3467 domain-containing protein [Propionibacteriaceae bacterium]
MTEHRIQINVPTDELAGSYADFVQAWHTNDYFVLDYAVWANLPVPDPDSGDLVHNATVVSRVRIPPAQVFELMKALNTQLDMWEKEQAAKKQNEA